MLQHNNRHAAGSGTNYGFNGFIFLHFSFLLFSFLFLSRCVIGLSFGLIKATKISPTNLVFAAPASPFIRVCVRMVYVHCQNKLLEDVWQHLLF